MLLHIVLCRLNLSAIFEWMQQHGAIIDLHYIILIILSIYWQNRLTILRDFGKLNVEPLESGF